MPSIISNSLLYRSSLGLLSWDSFPTSNVCKEYITTAFLVKELIVRKEPVFIKKEGIFYLKHEDGNFTEIFDSDGGFD